MFDRTLPIGSVVLLKTGTKRIMILGYCKYKQGDQNKIYDYVGCSYPEGFLSPEKTALFDHEQIARIYALGYQNETQFLFHEKLESKLKSMNRI